MENIIRILLLYFNILLNIKFSGYFLRTALPTNINANEIRKNNKYRKPKRVKELRKSARVSDFISSIISY